jgi:hypothetical protein
MNRAYSPLHVKPKGFVLPLIWWKSRESQFPNISFVIQQILWIHGSQIETKKIFNMVGMLTSLQHLSYKLTIWTSLYS